MYIIIIYIYVHNLTLSQKSLKAKDQIILIHFVAVPAWFEFQTVIGEIEWFTMLSGDRTFRRVRGESTLVRYLIFLKGHTKKTGNVPLPKNA